MNNINNGQKSGQRLKKHEHMKKQQLQVQLENMGLNITNLSPESDKCFESSPGHNTKPSIFGRLLFFSIIKTNILHLLSIKKICRCTTG
jgi:hypothetical protein